jgi:beta-glucosidase
MKMKPTAVEKRVEKLLAAMTLDEKLDYIGGYQDFYIRPIERLSLPAIKMADGPAGCRNYGPANAYPCAVCLAATWNPERAAAQGAGLGRDCRARGVHILLAPGVNIHRSPLCGRNFEYMGEDPFLAAFLAVPLIRGIQEQGVLGTVKHFAANNQEYGRHTISSDMDERTLREIYLPAFRAAVQDAKVACVMGGYNLVNGLHCTEHAHLNNDILKDEWGFDGILMSDWNSTYDGVGAANGGLDLEMPFAKLMTRETLSAAIKDGRLKPATLDDKVRRILRVIIRAGFLDREQTDRSIHLCDPVGAKAALETAREGIVLLKNNRKLLPLNVKKHRKIALIGPNAHPLSIGGGGSSAVTPFRSSSVFDALSLLAGEQATIGYEAGGTLPDYSSLFKNSTFECCAPDGTVQAGLSGEYFPNRKLEGPPALRRVDNHIDFEWIEQRPDWLPKEGFSIRWTGFIRPETSGEHLFVSRSDEGMRVWLDGELLIDDWCGHSPQLCRAVKNLKAGRKYDIRIEYDEAAGWAVAQFGWNRAEVLKGDHAAAVRLAGESDVAIVCVGFKAEQECEGLDRTFELPPTQADLIRAVQKVNPNTVVVLFAGGAVETEGWIDKAAAVLMAWYPGQEGGRAIAEILLGKVNPSGRLPVSFEKRAVDNPSFPWYRSKDAQKTEYREGLFIGYRGYEQGKTEPLFCFGHGLSYTTFKYDQLQITPQAVRPGVEVTVKCRVRNSGKIAGAEVVQLYVRDIESSVARPPKELKGASKVFLKPGQKKRITFRLRAADLAFFDPGRNGWTSEPGKFEVLIGASSRDVRLKGCFVVEEKR